jgi:hypothetical protein
MLTLRVLNKIKPVSDILQILGIISQLECSNIHLYLNENIWRAILICCSITGGDVMRRVSVIIRDCLLSLHFHLDALTYGQYIKANHSTKIKIPSAKIAGEILDQFYHLEEIGNVWFRQKSSPSNNASSLSSNLTNSGKGGGDSNSSSNKSKQSGTNTPVIIKTPLIEGTELIAKQLILQKSDGLMPFYRPKQSSAITIPINSSSFRSIDHLEIIKKEMQNRLNEFYVFVRTRYQKSRNNSLDEQNSHNLKGKSTLGSGLSALTRSSISPISAMTKFGKGFFSHGNNNNSGSKNAAAKQALLASSEDNSTSSTASSSISNTTPNSSFSAAVTASLTPPRSFTSSFGKFFGGGGSGHKAASSGAHAADTNEKRSGGNTDKEIRNNSSEPEKVNLQQALEEVSSEGGLQPISEEDDNPPPPQSTSAVASLSSSSEDLPPPPPPSSSISSDSPSAQKDGITVDAKQAVSQQTPSKQEKNEERTSFCSPTLTISELQDRLFETFSSEFSLRKKCISISNSNPCRQCGYILMDEELMNLWFRASSIDVHKPTNRLRSCRDMNEDKGIMCPECDKNIIPKLFISCYQLAVPSPLVSSSSSSTRDTSSASSSTRNPREDEENGEDEEQLLELWNQEVLFINPFLLRYELEELIVKFGERINQAGWLCSYYPALYWNILWFTNRCNLPSGFSFFPDTSLSPYLSPSSSASLSAKKEDFAPIFHPRKEYEVIRSKGCDKYYTKQDLLLPVIIGWKRSIVKAKSLRLLKGKSGNYLDIRDMFSKVPRKEFEIIAGPVLSSLDGSPFGMKQAMLNLSDCSSLFEAILKEYDDAKAEQARNKRLSAPNLVDLAQKETDHESNDHIDTKNGKAVSSLDSHSTEEKLPYHSATRKKQLRIARLIYINLLLLSVHFAKFQLYDPTRNGFNRDLEKVSQTVSLSCALVLFLCYYFSFPYYRKRNLIESILIVLSVFCQKVISKSYKRLKIV